MKSIDAEIFQVEQRLAMRKVALGHTAGAAKRRAVNRLKSPAMLVGAAVAGFLVVGLVRRKKNEAPAVAPETREQGKGFALGTLAMTGATWFIRSQFGGPVGLAQYVLGKLRDGRSPATAVPAESSPQVPR